MSDTIESIPASGRFMIALHPGEILRELYLEPLGLSVEAAASALALPPEHLDAVLSGRRAVTPDIAGCLETAFGQSAQSWLNIQTNYDLEQQRRRADVSKVKRLNLAA